jgi:predicted ATPase
MTEEYVQVALFSDDLIDENASLQPLMAFPRQATSPAPFIRRMWLQNLKGFRRLEVRFGAFNVLVGPNNCGKSTVLQAADLCFRLMQFHAEFQRGVLVRPRQGKQIMAEMLPVADPEDFWFQRDYRVRNERIPVIIGVELANGMEFEFEVKRQWGGLNSRMTKLPVGADEEVVRAILGRRPTLVPSSVGIVRIEDYRVPARLELLSVTGHHNEVLRNFLYELSRKDAAAFERLQADLQRHFGGKVGQVDFSLDSDQYISVDYQEGECEHDIFSAGGGFLQVLQLLTYLALHAPGIVLLDEPDAHLHSSLQRLVVDLLEGLSERDKIQVVMATHSKEIINYVDAVRILPISRNLETAQSLEHHASVLPILQDLGAIDNVDLAALVASKRCAFVEGKSDRRLLARFAAKLGSTVFEGHSQVVAIPLEGVDHPEKYVGLDILESVVGTRIRSLTVRDRDGLPDDMVEEIRDYAAQQEREVICLTRTDIENYLILPGVIWRVVCTELQERSAEVEQLPTQAQVQEEIEQIVDSLYNETFDSIAVQIDKHTVVYHGRHLDPSAINQRTRAFLDEKWTTLEGKLAIVIGKQALKAIRRRFQERWGISFTDNGLIDAMTDDEIAPEISEIITRLEAL